MDGVHDLGGLDGFGPVEHSPSEPFFAEDWERRAFRLTLGVMGALRVNGGRFRHSIERMEPAHYLGSSYYEHWLTAAATLAVESGRITREELESRAGGAFPVSLADRGTAPDDRVTCRASTASSCGTTVRLTSRTSKRTTVASSGTPRIRSASPRANCGATVHRRKT
jgi:hypothetical protein